MYLTHYCGSGHVKQSIIGPTYSSSWSQPSVTLELKRIEDSEADIIGKIKTQCLFLELPKNPSSLETDSKSASKMDEKKVLTDTEAQKLSETNYNTAIALFDNLQSKYRIERGGLTCDAPVFAFFAKEFIYFGSASTSSAKELDRYNEWVKYIYAEYDTAISYLVSKCGLIGSKVKELIPEQISTESISENPTINNDRKTAQLAQVLSIPNTNARLVATVELIKNFESAEKEQTLEVTYKSKRSSVIDVDLAVPGIPLTITASKKGSPTITLKSTTDSEGDAQIKITKNLEGYSVTLTINKTKIDTDVVKKKK
jgi:hypothetical protein